MSAMAVATTTHGGLLRAVMAVAAAVTGANSVAYLAVAVGAFTRLGRLGRRRGGLAH